MPKTSKKVVKTKAKSMPDMPKMAVSKNDLHKSVDHKVAWIALIGLSIAIVLFVYSNYNQVVLDLLTMR